MLLTGRIVLVVFWAVWAYPFIFRAPHNQKRPSITAIVPTRVGLVLECLGIFIACLSGLPNHNDLLKEALAARSARVLQQNAREDAAFAVKQGMAKTLYGIMRVLGRM